MRLAPQLVQKPRRSPKAPTVGAAESTGPPRRDARGCSCGSARVESRFQADRTPGNRRNLDRDQADTLKLKDSPIFVYKYRTTFLPAVRNNATFFGHEGGQI